MEAVPFTIQMTPCSGPIPELEIPMINTIAACLGSQHRKLNDLNMRFAFAATQLARDPGDADAYQRALKAWDDIRQDLWSHLQIEDELVFEWGEAHHAVSHTTLETLKNEREEMRKTIAALRAWSSGADSGAAAAGDRGSFAQTSLALARTLDAHIERYDGEVLPSILRALFRK